MNRPEPLCIGVLSDTHLGQVDETFEKQIRSAFAGCETIIHAGDLTDPAILDVFRGKTFYGVHGNMCTRAARALLPASAVFSISGYTFGLCHGDSIGYGVEEELLARFSQMMRMDCIISGHTHRPAISRFGSTLFVNPGSFAGTGKFGSPGTYAILNIDQTGLSADIHSLQQTQL